MEKNLDINKYNMDLLDEELDNPIPYQPYSYYCVLDFEASCKENDRTFPNEIIEFPIVLIDGKTGAVVSEFQQYVKPTVNPILDPFCTKLTGITQEQVDQGLDLVQTLDRVHQWLLANNLIDENGIEDFAFVTDGPWDMREFLDKECTRKNIERKSYFDKWVNIRWLFAEFFYCSRGGVNKMLSRLGLKFEGRPHSGIDDARNIARIAVGMMQKGCVLRVNDSLANPIDNNKVYGLNPRRSKANNSEDKDGEGKSSKQSSHSNEGKTRRKDRTENNTDSNNNNTNSNGHNKN
jgi:3'-5' exoribonuclease 1